MPETATTNNSRARHQRALNAVRKRYDQHQRATYNDGELALDIPTSFIAISRIPHIAE